MVGQNSRPSPRGSPPVVRDLLPSCSTDHENRLDLDWAVLVPSSLLVRLEEGTQLSELHFGDNPLLVSNLAVQGLPAAAQVSPVNQLLLLPCDSTRQPHIRSDIQILDNISCWSHDPTCEDCSTALARFYHCRVAVPPPSSPYFTDVNNLASGLVRVHGISTTEISLASM